MLESCLHLRAQVEKEKGKECIPSSFACETYFLHETWKKRKRRKEANDNVYIVGTTACKPIRKAAERKEKNEEKGRDAHSL